MMHRVTMRDGTVWYLDTEYDAAPARMSFYDDPQKLPFEEWNHTPHSYQGSGADITKLAMDIAKWAEMEEYQVAEIVPMSPPKPKFSEVSPPLSEYPQRYARDADTKKKINEELITIRKAMRRIEKLMEDL